jgi:sugar/nucleoside kinase (ribokinase family)
LAVPTADWPLRLAVRPDDPGRIVCVGNALVDRITLSSIDAFTAAGLEAGAMTLVDADCAHAIERAEDEWVEVAGGSAANTAVALSRLRGQVSFVGAVGNDATGDRYADDLTAAGVRCILHRVDSGTPTGVCHVFVGDDGTRTMATLLGASGEIAPDVMGAAGIEEASVLYLEGYLLDAPGSASALEKACATAKRSGVLVALSLSDPFVVERHGEVIRAMVEAETVDLVFGNEEEAYGLSGERSLDGVAQLFSRPDLVFVVTRGPGGAAVLSAGVVATVPASQVAEVVDTTGAGDAFAAGVLYGLLEGKEMLRSLVIGSVVAGEIISHIGARPVGDLLEMVEAAG